MKTLGNVYAAYQSLYTANNAVTWWNANPDLAEIVGLVRQMERENHGIG